MRAKEFIIEAIPLSKIRAASGPETPDNRDLSDRLKQSMSSKPPNFVAKNAKMGGAGAHKDKKKAEKQGDFKHKKQGVAEGSGLYGPFTVTINTGERPQSRTKTKKFRREDDAILWAEDWLEDAPQYVFATAEVTDPDGNVVWTTDEQGMAEETVNELSNQLLGRYKKAAGADASAADKAGDFEKGDKRFKGIVKATIKQGDNDSKKHKEQDVKEVAPPTAKGERMVKHIKKGYADNGKLTDKERSIAYATAWKAHNKS